VPLIIAELLVATDPLLLVLRCKSINNAHILDYKSGGPGSIPGTTRFSERKKKGKQVVGLERGPLSLVSKTEELLDRKVAAPV
jgi:hypothetical protein